MMILYLFIFSSFLNVDVSARASGMGGAFTAVDNDVSCAFYNPSGLSEIDKKEIFFMHNFYLLDMYQDFLTFLLPTKRGNLALSIDYLSYGKIPLYENYTKIGEYTAYDVIFILSFAKKFKKLKTGINFKTFYRKIERENSKGFAFDIGFLYPYKILKIGFTFSNIGPKTKFIEEKESLPFTIRGGISLNFKSFIFVFDLIKPYYSDIRICVGTEVKIKEIFALRAGYSSLKSFSIGFGTKFKNIKIDYAFVPFIQLYENTHKISLNIAF